jgi:hypothetical protein
MSGQARPSINTVRNCLRVSFVGLAQRRCPGKALPFTLRILGALLPSCSNNHGKALDNLYAVLGGECALLVFVPLTRHLQNFCITTRTGSTQLFTNFVCAQRIWRSSQPCQGSKTHPLSCVSICVSVCLIFCLSVIYIYMYIYMYVCIYIYTV